MKDEALIRYVGYLKQAPPGAIQKIDVGDVGIEFRQAPPSKQFSAIGRRGVAHALENQKGGCNRMRWPWSKAQVEKRETQPFTDAVIQAIARQAEGSMPGDPAQTWALETAAALYARAFSAAKVTGAAN